MAHAPLPPFTGSPAPPPKNAARGMSRERWMASSFAIGATCFLAGPISFYATLVGEPADSITFFVGSIFFTAGGALQSLLAYSDRRSGSSGRSLWWAALIQSAGTLLFNVNTYRALHVAISSPHYNRLVWSPDAIGSVCFLVSGAILYRASPRRGRLGWRPARVQRGWWEPAVNLLGCIFFAIAAVASYVVPATGSPLDLGAANFNTSAGALCFLACALATLLTGRTLKSARWHLSSLEHTIARDIHEL